MFGTVTAFFKKLQIKEGAEELFGSLFFTYISIILTGMNIVKHADPRMTGATTVLAAGFLVSSILAYRQKKTAARILILILCGSVFSFFALIGGNDGFAILWILLVPVIGSLWVGFRDGFILGLFFQIFLIILFYTPLSGYVKEYYSSTFILRFPVLYFAAFGSITFLMWQRSELTHELYKKTYFDSLTGLYNRRFYDELIEKIKAEGLDPEMVYYSFDLNRLKYANDNFGHKAGDELISAAAQIIAEAFEGGYCCRTGGDEYTVLSSKHDPEEALKRMREIASAWKGEYMQSISISAGYASAKQEPGLGLDELAVLADNRMYEEKEEYHRLYGTGR